MPGIPPRRGSGPPDPGAYAVGPSTGFRPAPRPRKPRHPRGLAAVVLAPLLLAACGEDAPDESSAPWATSTPGYVVGPGDSRVGPVVFTEVTAAAGIDFRHVTGAFGEKWMPETIGSGGGFLDYDGDGRIDVFLVNSAPWPGRGDGEAPGSRLYRNQGDGTFRDVSEGTGILAATREVYGMGSIFADYDADGDTDIYVTALGENLLLRNDGSRFIRVPRAGGATGNPPEAAGPEGWSTAASWVDVDRNGFLDLFVCNYVRWTPETDLFTTRDGVTKSYATPEEYPGQSCRLYANRDGRGFTDVTREAGVENPEGKSLGVVVADFDGDRWPDLFVANDMQPNFLYRNQGDGTFRNVALDAGVAFDEFGRARAGMGVDVADVDGRGGLSIAIGNFSNEALSLYTPVGGGVFQDLAGSARLTRPTLLALTFGVGLTDLDLNGYPDLVMANGHIEPEIARINPDVTFAQSPLLFLNTGEGRFVDATEAAGEDFFRPMVGRGLAFADYDDDGDVDLLLTSNGGPPRLLRNDTPPEARGGGLRVQLLGRAPNRDAVGAEIRLHTREGVQRRRVRAGSSYLSQSVRNPALFGLGELDQADSLVVLWPDGSASRVSGPLPAGETVRVRQPSGPPPSPGS